MSWTLVPQGNPVPLNACPPGPFAVNGSLGFRSEYATTLEGPRRHQVDAYCFESGEYFWGGAKGVEARGNLMVQPLALATTPPTTNDAIPAGMVRPSDDAIAELLKRLLDWAPDLTVVRKDRQEAIEAISSLSATPKRSPTPKGGLPGRGEGSCFLCADKCRGHSAGRPEEWEPEPGSEAAEAIRDGGEGG